MSRKSIFVLCLLKKTSSELKKAFFFAVNSPIVQGSAKSLTFVWSAKTQKAIEQKYSAFFLTDLACFLKRICFELKKVFLLGKVSFSVERVPCLLEKDLFRDEKSIFPYFGKVIFWVKKFNVQLKRMSLSRKKYFCLQKFHLQLKKSSMLA